MYKEIEYFLQKRKKKPEVRRGFLGSKLKFAHARKFTIKTRYYVCTNEWSCKTLPTIIVCERECIVYAIYISF